MKSVTVDMKATFLSALAHDGAINEAELSNENLTKMYGELQKQVRESIGKQEALLRDIQVKGYRYTRCDQKVR